MINITEGPRPVISDSNVPDRNAPPVAPTGTVQVQDESSVIELPSYLKIEPNNATDKTTTLRFQKSEISGKMVLNIHDSDGNVVRTIPDEELARIARHIQEYMRGRRSAGILLDEIA